MVSLHFCLKEEILNSKKTKGNPKIALKIRTQAKTETGKFVSAQTVRNILHEAVYNRRTARKKYTNKTNTKKLICYGKEHENDSHEFWWTFVSQMKGNLCFLSQIGKKKSGGERTVN